MLCLDDVCDFRLAEDGPPIDYGYWRGRRTRCARVVRSPGPGLAPARKANDLERLRGQAVTVWRVAGNRGLLRWRDDAIDQAVVLCLLRCHEEVALDVTLHLFLRAAGVLRINPNHDLAHV